jgi:hypothetical protein
MSPSGFSYQQFYIKFIEDKYFSSFYTHQRIIKFLLKGIDQWEKRRVSSGIIW